MHRVLTGSAESWTVLGEDGLPAEPAEAYLAYLTALERSPNTLRAYAHSLRMWLEFLSGQRTGWREAGVEQVARFAAWLRAPAANVIVLDAGESARTAATVNRHLAAVFGFYDFHARAGVGLAADLVAWRRVGRGSYRPFLHHVTAGKPVPVRPIKLAVPQRIPDTLTDEQIRALLEACTRLRDRFLMALLAESGLRIGQALGLRHADVVSRDKLIRVVPRDDNANGARAKTRGVHQVPVSASLIRLYSEYMHVEYGPLDSDYVLSRYPDNTNCPDLAVIPSIGLVRRSARWLCRGCRITPAVTGFRGRRGAGLVACSGRVARLVVWCGPALVLSA